MKIYCLVCRKKTENKDVKVIKTKKWQFTNEISMLNLWK